MKKALILFMLATVLIAGPVISLVNPTPAPTPQMFESAKEINYRPYSLVVPSKQATEVELFVPSKQIVEVNSKPIKSPSIMESFSSAVSKVFNAWKPSKSIVSVVSEKTGLPAATTQYTSCELIPVNVELPTIATQEFNIICYGLGLFPGDEVQINCPAMDWSTDIAGATLTSLTPNSSSTLDYSNAQPGLWHVTAMKPSTQIQPDQLEPELECTANVQIVQDAVDCALTPGSANLQGGEQQQFDVTCFDNSHAVTDCPMIYWSTTADGTHVNPREDNESTTLYTGLVNSAGEVRASILNTGLTNPTSLVLTTCTAPVTVEYYYANSCEITPRYSDVLINGQQELNISCFDQFSNPINCPGDLAWSTTVTGSTILQQDNASAMFYAGGVDARGNAKAEFSVNGGGFFGSVECKSFIHVYDPSVTNTCEIEPSTAFVPFNGEQQFNVSCYNVDDQVVDCPVMNWSFTSMAFIGHVAPTQDNSSTTFYAVGTSEGTGTIGAIYDSDSPFMSMPPCSARVTVFDPDKPKSCEVNPIDSLVPINGNQQFAVTCFSANGTAVDCPLMDWETNVTGSTVNPAQSEDNTTFYAGSIEAIGGVSATKSLGMHFDDLFECSAEVQVFDPAVIDSCDLTPNSINVEVNYSQEFTLTCFNIVNDQINCNLFDWSTDVAGSWMSPLQNNSSSTFYAGENAAIGFVYANSTDASCNASVNVFEPTLAESCALSPLNAFVSANSSQQFSATCFDNMSQPINCPTLDWSTDVPNSWVNPTQDNSSTTFYSGTTPSSGFVYADHANFACQAGVTVTTEASSCALTPLYTQVTVNSTELFTATCYDQFSNLVTCPTLNWATTNIGGWMDPLQSTLSSTLNTGTTPEQGASVTASTVNFSCASTVDVETLNASSCAITPNSINMSTNSTEDFIIACFDTLLNPVTCPSMNWSTDAPASWVNPTQDNDGTTLYSGLTAGNGFVYADHSLLSCQASVNIDAPQQNESTSCSLTPLTAQVPINGSQVFGVQCFDSSNQTVDCPVMDWITNVSGAWMAPNQSEFNSTFYAGTIVANGSINASTANYSCTAQIEVTPLTAVSCELSPNATSMQTNSTQQFNATCFDSVNQTVGCPTLTWDTTLLTGYVQPNQSSTYTLLYSGSTENGSVSAEYVNGQNFSCTAQVEVVDVTPVVSSCTILPDPASVVVNGQQVFTVGCLDQFAQPIACPIFDWTTNVTNGTMNPLNSTNSSTLTAGNVTETNKTIIATTGLVSCQAVVNVVDVNDPVSCELSPLTAFVQLNNSQLFTVTCRNSTNGTVDCPIMNWNTNSSNSTMSPNQSNVSSTFNAGFVEESASISATAGFTCSAIVEVYSPSAVSCTLSPSSASVVVGAQQVFTATCRDLGNAVITCPTLDWSTTVSGSSMSPLQSIDSSTFTAGSIVTGGLVQATRGSDFFCTANAEVTSGQQGGGGDNGHDIYAGGGSSGGSRTGPIKSTPTPTPTDIPRRPSKSYQPTLVPTPTINPTIQPIITPTPTPEPGPATGLFTQATTSWIVVILGLFASGISIFRKQLGL